MKVTIDHLLLLIKEHGAEKALRYINIEEIEDHDAKVIARTIKFSGEMLETVLVDKIHERDNVSAGEVGNKDK